MAFNIFEDETIMAEFDRISAEPIDTEPYSLVHNPKPVVESIVDFNGNKIDTGSWSTGDGVDENKKKVGKAKTATDPKLTKKTAAEKAGEKKDDGKIIENVDAKEKKDGGKTTEVKTNTEVKVDKAPKAGSGSSFDSAAKSAATDNRKGADDNKKFDDSAKVQKSIDIFKKSVRALATDTKTAADAEKVLKKFDKISSYLKPKTESVNPTMEGTDDFNSRLNAALHPGTDTNDPANARFEFMKKFYNKYWDMKEQIFDDPHESMNLRMERDRSTGNIKLYNLGGSEHPNVLIAETSLKLSPNTPIGKMYTKFNYGDEVTTYIEKYDDAEIEQAILDIAKSWGNRYNYMKKKRMAGKF